MGARLLDRRGGLFDRNLPGGVSGQCGPEDANSDLWDRCERRVDREGTCRRLSAERTAEGVAAAFTPLLHAIERRLSGQSGHTGTLRVCPPRRDQRSSFFETRSDQLPQCPYLFRTNSAKESADRLPLRLEQWRFPAAWKVGEPGRICRPVLRRGPQAPLLRQE